MINIIVTGSRHAIDYEFTYDVLNTFHQCLVKLFVGDAKGIDNHTRAWCFHLQKEHQIFVADWIKYKRPAGPIRNREMLEAAKKQSEEMRLPLILLAFPGGSGTEGCIKIAKELNIQVFRVEKS